MSEKSDFDWALVSCAVAGKIEGGKISGVRIVLGSGCARAVALRRGGGNLWRERRWMKNPPERRRPSLWRRRHLRAQWIQGADRSRSYSARAPETGRMRRSACRFFRNKSMCVSGMRAEAEDEESGAAGYCWCNRTRGGSHSQYKETADHRRRYLERVHDDRLHRHNIAYPAAEFDAGGSAQRAEPWHTLPTHYFHQPGATVYDLQQPGLSIGAVIPRSLVLTYLPRYGMAPGLDTDTRPLVVFFMISSSICSVR